MSRPSIALKLLPSILLCLLFLAHPQPVSALNCSVATISDGDADWVDNDSSDNLDVNFCVTGSAEEISNIVAITAVCRSSPYSPINPYCHQDPPLGLPDPFPPARNTLPVQPLIGVDDRDPNLHYSCFNLLDLDRNMGSIDISALDAGGNNLCSSNGVYVVPGDYSFFEYFRQSIGRIIGPAPAILHYTCANGISINTALGCISTDVITGQFLIDIYQIIVPLSGGFALLLIIIGIAIITTSAGDPKKLAAGKNLITSTISGLIFILCSVYLMNLIGVKILSLPGL